MAGSTYLDLTNRLLRRLNEVELTSGTFPTAIGIHATAKDTVLDTIREINNTRIDWPFNAVEHSQILDIGVEEYAWIDQFNTADWNSFQLQADDTLGTSYKRLKAISREEWYERARDIDYDSGTDGRGMPIFVFPSHGMGFGVTPSPDKEYPIKFRYYKAPDDISLYDDTVTIPTKFDYVILAGSLMKMDKFKEDKDGFTIEMKRFTDGLRDMTNLFLPNPIYMYDGRVNYGGGNRSRIMWTGY
jgi:hypothetical protein